MKPDLKQVVLAFLVFFGFVFLQDLGYFYTIVTCPLPEHYI